MPELTKELIGMDRISPSALDCFEQCPRLFYYQNWLGLNIDNDKLHMDFGTAIHSAIEAVYLEYDRNFGGGWESGNFENVKKRFLQRWKPTSISDQSYQNYMRTKAGRESGFRSVIELYSHFKNDGLKMLESYWKEKELLLTEYGHDLSEFELPRRLEMVCPTDPNKKLPIPLSYRIDARNKDCTVQVDFKTSGSKYDEEETRKKIQGQCYVFGTLMETGKLVGRFDYVVLRKGLKSDDRIQVVKLEYDEADMVAFYFRVEAILHKIANREFDIPKVGHLHFCRCKDYEEALSVK